MSVGRPDSRQLVRAEVGVDGDVILTVTDAAGYFTDVVLDPLEALAVSRMIVDVAEQAEGARRIVDTPTDDGPVHA